MGWLFKFNVSESVLLIMLSDTPGTPHLHLHAHCGLFLGPSSSWYRRMCRLILDLTCPRPLGCPWDAPHPASWNSEHFHVAAGCEAPPSSEPLGSSWVLWLLPASSQGPLVYGPIRVSPLIFQCCHRFTSLLLFSPHPPSSLPSHSLFHDFCGLAGRRDCSVGLACPLESGSGGFLFSHSGLRVHRVVPHRVPLCSAPVLSACWICP